MNLANPANAESLTVDDFNFNLLSSEDRVTFHIRNSGQTEIHVTGVKLNGHSNQTIPDLINSTEALRGTLDLKPNETREIDVFLAPFINVFLSAAPMSSPPTEAQALNFISVVKSTPCTFTFVTQANREYNFTTPGLGDALVDLWSGSATQGFMYTEQLLITAVNFSGTSGGKEISVNAKNSGTTQVTINEFMINNVRQNYTPQAIAANDHIMLTVSLDWISGNTYQIKLISSQGNSYSYMATAS
jgi:hypothetical protein